MLMPKPHQHAKAIHAWADGAEIEFRVNPTRIAYGPSNYWNPCRNPDWHENFEYRVVSPVDTNLHMEVARLNVLAKMHEDGD